MAHDNGCSMCDTESGHMRELLSDVEFFFLGFFTFFYVGNLD